MNEPIKVINTFYSDTLKTASHNKMKTPEDQNLYLLAFFGLIRAGYPFTVSDIPVNDKQDGNMEKNRNKPSHEKKNTETMPAETVPLKRILSVVIGDVGYTCDEDLLADRFGKAFTVLESQQTPKKIRKEEDSDFVMPFVRFEEEEEKGAKEVEPETDTNAGKDSSPTLSYIVSDYSYPDDGPDRKEYDTFLFNIHEIDVFFADGTRSRFSACVYPVYMKTEDSLAADIFAVVTDTNGKIRCGMSAIGDNGQKSINAEFAECTLVIRGTWEDGNFESKCSILSSNGDQSTLREKVTHIKPSKRTASFYLRHSGTDGTYLDVFPLTLLRNDPTTGLAPAVVIIEDGHSRKIYCGDNNTYLSLWYDGSQKRIDIFWAGNALNVSISEISEE